MLGSFLWLVTSFTTSPVEVREPERDSAACDSSCDGERHRVGLSIFLLGPPRMERDGVAVEPPRGHKAWGLLAYLLRSPIAPSRERLAGLLFPEADDPLGALRWTLSALRRQLGSAELRGDPLQLALPSGTFVDVDVLSSGSWPEAVALPGLGHELLDGLAFRSSPGFEMWLEHERRHVAGTTGAVLHQAALARLARGQFAEALGHASELVRLNPYEENAHVLLVRCLRAAGDLEGAARQVEACTELFRRELGIDPTPALRAAASAYELPVESRVSGRAAASAQVEAGEAAIAAGAGEVGLQRLRSAVAAARNVDDSELLARALVALGGALVHAPVHGADEEGAAALHEGTLLAERVGSSDVAAKGWREISWVQFLRAHYDRTEESLTRTAELAGGNDAELAWVALIRGTSAHDVGDHRTAGELLPAAVERSERLPAGQPLALALTFLGRFHLLRGELGDARVVLDRALGEAESRGMTAFVPWPECFLAELDLLSGELERAEERFEHAFALGCQVGDPCWESAAVRGLGLVAAARGELDRALELLVDAPKVCRRLPDTYLWIVVYGLDALCAVAVDHGAEAAPRWIEELEATAARCGMQELLLHAAVYRARLGEPGALDVARSLAAQIENPAVPPLLAAVDLGAAA
jgi:DNA-binding SARP family transcriptional activator